MNYAKMFSRLCPHTHPRGCTYEFKQFFKIYKYLNTRVFHFFLAASSTRYLTSVPYFTFSVLFFLIYLFISFPRDLFRFCVKRKHYCCCNGERVDFLCKSVYSVTQPRILVNHWIISILCNATFPSFHLCIVGSHFEPL